MYWPVSKQVPVVDSWEHRNEPSHSTEGTTFLYHRSRWWPLKTISASQIRFSSYEQDRNTAVSDTLLLFGSIHLPLSFIRDNIILLHLYVRKLSFLFCNKVSILCGMPLEYLSLCFFYRRYRRDLRRILFPSYSVNYTLNHDVQKALNQQ